MALDYENSGVSVKKGDDFADFIKAFPSKAVSKGIGGFAGGIELDTEKYKNPIIMSTTDGVGTKLLIAKKLNNWKTVGIDLVAMNVNDLIVCGCEPVNFLDYIATGKIDDERLHDIISGIILGCEQAECVLTGGETAEMPGMYADDDVDLAGFALGIVDKNKVLPKLDAMNAHDVILGLPSTGLHSNGYSLARKAVPEDNLELYKEMLTPTKIYIKEMKKLLSTQKILGAAHITGSGLLGNFLRVIPSHLKPAFTWDWKVPSIFEAIQKLGGISTNEMREVFNMGIGMALVVAKENESEVLDYAKKEGIDIVRMGELMNV